MGFTTRGRRAGSGGEEQGAGSRGEDMKLRKEDARKCLAWFREEEFPLLKRLAQGDPERMAEVEAFEQDVEESFAYLAE
jgi:hypothetical protein